MIKYTISIFGHRQVFNKEEVRQRLYTCLKSKIEGKKTRVLVGTHGDFDRLALGVCKQLKREGCNIHISLVYTSQKAIIRDRQVDEYDYDKDIEIMMYDIEQEHYKRQIIVSNQKMVDDSDEIITYFNERNTIYSGTYHIIKYAKQNNKPVYNLFENIIKKLV